MQSQRRRATSKKRGGAAAVPRVLVVDADMNAAVGAFACLTQLGYDVLVATSEVEALRYLGARSFDCIVVDLDQVEVARTVIDEMRRYPPGTVGLIVTSSGADHSVVDALREGAQDYIRKPCDPDILKVSAARAIERASLARTMRELVEDFDSANGRLRAFADELQAQVDRITAELRLKVAELDQANSQLAAERRRREEFIAMVAHDLAGPLTTVNGYMQLLTRPTTPTDAQDRARRVITSESRRMARLLRDLTDAVPLTSGHFRVQTVTCDLTDIVAEQVELAQLRTEHHHFRLEKPPEPLRATCDPDRFAQVISNLLSNAEKHTPEGDITVKLWLDDDQVRLLVRDQGPGIPPGHLQRIFEPGVRVKTNADSAPSGAGLGLYIARGIVDALGGHIWAESDGVHGAVFQLSLPLATAT